MAAVMNVPAPQLFTGPDDLKCSKCGSPDFIRSGAPAHKLLCLACVPAQTRVPSAGEAIAAELDNILVCFQVVYDIADGLEDDERTVQSIGIERLQEMIRSLRA